MSSNADKKYLPKLQIGVDSDAKYSYTKCCVRNFRSENSCCKNTTKINSQKG